MQPSAGTSSRPPFAFLTSFNVLVPGIFAPVTAHLSLSKQVWALIRGHAFPKGKEDREDKNPPHRLAQVFILEHSLTLFSSQSCKLGSNRRLLSPSQSPRKLLAEARGESVNVLVLISPSAVGVRTAA